MKATKTQYAKPVYVASNPRGCCNTVEVRAVCGDCAAEVEHPDKIISMSAARRLLANNRARARRHERNGGETENMGSTQCMISHCAYCATVLNAGREMDAYTGNLTRA
ncbi:MAG: hypothetical protein IMZ57_02235 [Acidobacteria bacterium]|nr:hypothetical protein [Acidobacteriota bacterium]